MFRYLPEQASELAHKVDQVNNFITDVSVFFTVAVVGVMIYFAIRYRQRGGKDHDTPAIEGNPFFEVVWTVVPTIISLAVATYGIRVYDQTRTVPEDAHEIVVWGQMWKWDFEYPNGKRTTGEFVIPVNKSVKLVLSSRDVLHSFFVPTMRVKRDAVPGMYTYVHFKPIKTGTYRVFCAEYCGRLHSKMLATLHVVSEAEYERWLNDDSEAVMRAAMDPVELGKGLYEKQGCNACHSMDGSRVIGPSLLKLFNRAGKFVDGTDYVADENYLKRSILDPRAEIVAGYEASASVMPVFEGQLSDDEVHALIAFIKSLDGSQPVEVEEEEETEVKDLSKLTPAERGERLYNQKACVGCHSLDGSRVVGPSFKGLYGTEGALDGGASYVADDDYIKRSILKPAEQIVAGLSLIHI